MGAAIIAVLAGASGACSDEGGQGDGGSPDASVPPDAAPADALPRDALASDGETDGGSRDAALDAGARDGGPTDAAALDAAGPDTGLPLDASVGSSGPVTVAGSFGGRPAVLREAVSFIEVQTNDRRLDTIRMLGVEALCPYVEYGYSLPSTGLLELRIDQNSPFGAMPAAPAPGDYPIGLHDDGSLFLSVSARFDRTDAACASTIANDVGLASTGTITIQALSANEAAGRFVLGFPGGERLTGTFRAPRCVPAPGTPVCLR